MKRFEKYFYYKIFDADKSWLDFYLHFTRLLLIIRQNQHIIIIVIMAKYEKYDWSGVYDSKNFLCGFGSPWSERCNCSRRSDNFGFLCQCQKKACWWQYRWWRGHIYVHKLYAGILPITFSTLPCFLNSILIKWRVLCP